MCLFHGNVNRFPQDDEQGEVPRGVLVTIVECGGV
jgi:hypothetical protein